MRNANQRKAVAFVGFSLCLMQRVRNPTTRRLPQSALPAITLWERSAECTRFCYSVIEYCLVG